MKRSYRLKDLDCANCAMKMENEIKRIDGVKAASVSFMTQRMTLEVEDNADMDAVIQKAAQICKRIEPDCKIIL